MFICSGGAHYYPWHKKNYVWCTQVLVRFDHPWRTLMLGAIHPLGTCRQYAAVLEKTEPSKQPLRFSRLLPFVNDHMRGC